MATFPGFRMLPNGGSRVFLQVNGNVEVSELKAEGRLVYRMKGAQAIQTNRFPLVTSFFATPVSKVQLVSQGPDLDLVIELRQQTEAKYNVAQADNGIVLQVDFPKTAVDQHPPPQAVETTPRRVSTRARSQEPTPEEDDAPVDY